MASSSSSSTFIDSATEANTALLQDCQKPDIMAQSRSLCRQSGVPQGPDELRRVQHFVSQCIIKLLTKHNITQKDGRPYVSSSPKGFLQGPDTWLASKGYYLSGWPRGLPKGSISIWPSSYTFALAAMFINNTITLRPLKGAARSEQPAVLPQCVNGRSKTPPVDKAPNRVPSEVHGRKVGDHDSDQDAEGESEQESLGSEIIVLPVSACDIRSYPADVESLPRRPSTSTNSSDMTAVNSSSIVSSKIVDHGPFRDRNFADATSTSREEPLPSRTIIQTSHALHHASGSQFPVSNNASRLKRRKTLMSESYTDELKYQMSRSESSYTEERMYPGAPPSDATINWIPPMSAARDLKRTRKA